MKILVQFSGGKDSLASLIWAKEKFGKNVIAVFCDTKWEHEETYKHIKQVIEKMEVQLVTLTSKKHDGFVGMAINKKRFPSTKARFCTEELKVKPFIDYILGLSEDVIIIQGIRSDESLSRSKMQAECSFFKYYFEPYGFDKNGKPKTYSYRKKEIKKFVEIYTNDVIRPIFSWTAEKVFDYIHANGFEANPLYKRGFGRVGCMPCIMVRKSELKAIIENEPEYFDRILEAEKKVGRTFFPPKYIPNHATKNGQYPEATDVKKYIEGQNETIDLFPKTNKCSSYYSLCE